MSMWKKDQDADSSAGPLAPPSRPSGASTTTPAVIGPSIAIRGELAGQQDLLIEGHFEGEIEVPEHQVTIGRGGRVKAEIRADVIIIEGELRGNIAARKQAVVRASGKVQGDIKAPRVALEEGCQFKGEIDMEPDRGAKPSEAPAPRADHSGKGTEATEKADKGQPSEPKKGEQVEAAATGSRSERPGDRPA